MHTNTHADFADKYVFQEIKHSVWLHISNTDKTY